jgi:hypothetical protein
MPICATFMSGAEESDKVALPATTQSWAMVDTLLGTVLENRGPYGCHARPRSLRNVTHTSPAAFVRTTNPRSK